MASTARFYTHGRFALMGELDPEAQPSAIGAVAT
jgi:hypothetical protein